MGDDETVTIETTEVDPDNVEETVTVSSDLEGNKHGREEEGDRLWGRGLKRRRKVIKVGSGQEEGEEDDVCGRGY